MRAMLKSQPASSQDSAAAQGSSAAKVLADCAPMSNGVPQDTTVDDVILTPSPLMEEGRGEGGAVSTALTQEPLSPTLSHKGREGQTKPSEIGGRQGPEPTRFGDWEKSGRCIDF